MSPKRFELSYSGYVCLDVDQIWPDGDAPENPTPEDVLEVIEDAGGPVGILRDWNIDDHLTLDVHEWTPPKPRGTP